MRAEQVRRSSRLRRYRALVASCGAGALAAAAVISACNSTSQPPLLRDQVDGSITGDASETDGVGADGPEDSSTVTGEGSLDSSSSQGFDVVPTDAPVTPQGDAATTSSCSPTTTWGPPTNVPGLPTFMSATEPMVTVTNDGLTVAWVADAGNGLGTVSVADRAADTDPFGTPNLLTQMEIPGIDGGEQYFPFDRVALSGDGLTLVAAAVGGLQMAQFQRFKRSGSFSGMPLSTRYQSLTSSLMPGEYVGGPVLSNDGEDLIYSKYGQSQTVTVYESFTTGTNSWPSGTPQTNAALTISSGMRMLPSSLSEDRLTLFFWDPAKGATEGAFRTTTTGAFTVAEPFGVRYSLQSSHSCARLYYVAASPSGGYVLQQVDATSPADE
jgi:hypothetical protein